jgi:hypothetical protein
VSPQNRNALLSGTIGIDAYQDHIGSQAEHSVGCAPTPDTACREMLQRTKPLPVGACQVLFMA